MSRDSASLSVFVVTHTHWDREWYHSATRFRQRLIPLVDELLAASPDEPPFLLDGQAILLEDYLAIRPAERGALTEALLSGRIEAGPWYVLADELIPGGEALIRNLLAGRRVLSSLGGATAPAVLYSPDAFGHPASLPLLAAGFGIPLAVLWRGLGGPEWPNGDSFRWIAADGSSVVVHHLPPSGYEFASNLPFDPAFARARWDEIERILVPRARLGALLLLNGADHHAPQRDLQQAVDRLGEAAAPHRVQRTGLRAAAQVLVERAAAADLPEIRGELRSSFGYTWSLQGTFAVRAPLKQRAVRLEREMVRDVEPWLALGRRSPAVPPASLEHAAWQTLLQCHPHDTLCGCSIDAVGRAMASRLESSEDQARGLRTDGIGALIGHDPDESIDQRPRWRPSVVVRNRAARVRNGIAELELLTFVRDVPVGPDSAFAQLAETPDEPVLIDGGRIRYQVLEERRRNDRLEPRRRYPDNDLVRAQRVVAWLPDVRGYGTVTFPLTAGAGAAPEGDVRTGASRDGSTWLENGFLRVTHESTGAISLSGRDGSLELRDFIELEDAGDAGDTYTPSLIEPVIRARSAHRARVIHSGPLRGEIEAEFLLSIPEQSSRDGRAATSVSMAVRMALAIDAGARFLRVRVTCDNVARDHRLRLVCATGVRNGDVHADAAFGPVARRPAAPPPYDDGRERALPTAPMHRYVTCCDDRSSMTIFANGATEYEVLKDGRVAITLFRGVGELSRADLPERPGHAGWPSPTPEAQCLGPIASELACLPLGPRTQQVIHEIEQAADDALFPLTGETIRALLASPAPTVGVELSGTGLAFGACKRSEDGEWMVLRCVNLLERAVEGSWGVDKQKREARLARLDETPGAVLQVSEGRVEFLAGPRAVVTVLVR